MEATVREAIASDSPAIRVVIADAFADELVADLWSALETRSGTLSIVAEFNDAIVGHTGLSWGWIDASDRLVDVMILSPLSVVPAHQGTGVGRALVARAAEAAESALCPVLFVEGDPRYYERVGFVPAADHGFTPPSTRIPLPAFQCMLLPSYESSITGALVYPDTFWAFDSVGLRGERLEQFGV